MATHVQLTDLAPYAEPAELLASDATSEIEQALELLSQGNRRLAVSYLRDAISLCRDAANAIEGQP